MYSNNTNVVIKECKARLQEFLQKLQTRVLQCPLASSPGSLTHSHWNCWGRGWESLGMRLSVPRPFPPLRKGQQRQTCRLAQNSQFARNRWIDCGGRCLTSVGLTQAHPNNGGDHQQVYTKFFLTCFQQVYMTRYPVSAWWLAYITTVVTLIFKLLYMNEIHFCGQEFYTMMKSRLFPVIH